LSIVSLLLYWDTIEMTQSIQYLNVDNENCYDPTQSAKKGPFQTFLKLTDSNEQLRDQFSMIVLRNKKELKSLSTSIGKDCLKVTLEFFKSEKDLIYYGPLLFNYELTYQPFYLLLFLGEKFVFETLISTNSVFEITDSLLTKLLKYH